jgi:formin 2
MTDFVFFSSAPEFDVSELEKLFSANVPKPTDSSGKSGGRRKSTGSKPDKVHLVFFYMDINET